MIQRASKCGDPLHSRASETMPQHERLETMTDKKPGGVYVPALTPFKAMVLASALFVTLHFSILSAPYLFALAMLLGWTKYKTGSLYPAMLIHFLHNYVVLEFFW